MILLILLTYVLIAFMTIYQYNEQTNNYNKRRFERKENATRLSVKYELDNAKNSLKTEDLYDFFASPIVEIAKVHKVNINLYDLEGNLLLSSKANLQKKKVEDGLDFISKADLLLLEKNYRLIQGVDIDEKRFQSSYTYLKNKRGTLIGVLKLHYIQDNSVQDRNLNEFLQRLAFVYLLMFAIAIVFAYFLSSYITRSLNTIIEKIGKTGLQIKNEKIVMGDTSREITKLVFAYNNMIDQLEDTAVKLAASEREQAWREMAKQVAHEIKNPLTPMRLTVQSFERRFNPEDPKISEKLKEYSETIIQQIDIMSSIATAFSDFAQMPSQQKELIDAVGVIKKALDIFEDRNINFESNSEKSFILVDKSQLVRVVTNLIKNAIHAVEEIEDPKINVSLINRENNFEIIVKDNGKGIQEELKSLIFEPRFTTKTSGMGLGLAMSKKIIETYNGEIIFESEVGKGTAFTITIPKE
tara:strand:- start:23454 stop:24863 length:1410 start_codon:yes stop_codon:yes gene_type:complete